MKSAAALSLMAGEIEAKSQKRHLLSYLKFNTAPHIPTVSFKQKKHLLPGGGGGKKEEKRQLEAKSGNFPTNIAKKGIFRHFGGNFAKKASKLPSSILFHAAQAPPKYF